jgi:hypothetical protein
MEKVRQKRGKESSRERSVGGERSSKDIDM